MTDATDNRAAEPCFHELPRSIQRIEKCGLCRQPFTVLTQLHHRAHLCTGCMLRTLRPYDFTRASERRQIRGAAGTGEGAEETLERLPAPEPRCNGVETGCTATPDCPVHMGGDHA